MEKIEYISHIIEQNHDEFFEKLCKRVTEIQEMGYDVEVQYSSTNFHFSALILGRKKDV